VAFTDRFDYSYRSLRWLTEIDAESMQPVNNEFRTDV